MISGLVTASSPRLHCSEGKEEWTVMLLEKRPRPPMRRTTSSTEFASSVLFDVEAPQPFDQVAIGVRHLESRWGADWRTTWYTGSMLSPRGGVHRRSSGDFAAPFLRACGLCNRGLGPGRDAYMYRYFHSVTNLLRYKSRLFGFCRQFPV